MTSNLKNIFNAALSLHGDDYYTKLVPDYVINNLNPRFTCRTYQKEAIGRYVFYQNNYVDRSRNSPTHLLFHMATGSGKTLIMAALMIYLYRQGYNNFVFFVNSNNIIDKTRENFLNKASNKYLFSGRNMIHGKPFTIREVNNFYESAPEAINIIFTTIQGLHFTLNNPKENCTTYEDLTNNKVVLISDEAHHINVETKKGIDLSTSEAIDTVSWESTVHKTLLSRTDNIMLEFTATMPLDDIGIGNKYADKLIFDYPLREFRMDGYSKEVKVLQSDLTPIDRALQSIILSQYRRKIFAKYQKQIKPVVLFKSRTIKESKSFYKQFSHLIEHLRPEDLVAIKNRSYEYPMKLVFQYLDQNRITLDDLADELKEDFSKHKLLVINSKEESESKQIAVNSLEDLDNEYRAVFAVDKLNEGWDVLNLFDIVRLYNTRDARAGKPGKTTISEAQLIGRGARYCPFQITVDQPMYCRKYDNDLTNELRICEELYYHSAYNPRYIQELNTALIEIGIKPKQTIEREMRLKDNFTNSIFYKTSFVFLNSQDSINRSDIFSINSSFIKQEFTVNLFTGFSTSDNVFDSVNVNKLNRAEKLLILPDLGEPVIRKAMHKHTLYQFSKLIKLFPNLSSISEFINSDKYLGQVQINVTGLPEQVKNPSQAEKLYIAQEVLETVKQHLEIEKIEKIGSPIFKPFLLKDKIFNKTLNFSVSDSEDKETGKSMCSPTESNHYLDLSKRDWYVFEDCFGTSEEKHLIKYIDRMYDRLRMTYDEIYLIRNERHFKLYSFEDGRPLEPDFILYLSNKKTKSESHYQVFIEPKGQHLLKQDEWKEIFLRSLKEKHLIEQLWKDKHYEVWGMPFFNNATKSFEFDSKFNNLIRQDLSQPDKNNT